ncbi:hypothetical protein E4U38_006232 [Claviceps purpurea]|nr:hypothetical protein E4U38_006232 [Claviceps purpurea]
MGQATVDSHNTRAEFENTTSLFDLLHNSLILRHITPHLPIHSLLQLSATSKSIRSLIRTTPGVFRHLDLTRVQRVADFDDNPIGSGRDVWHYAQVDDNLTQDDVESGPLRCILSVIRRQNILRDVQTLVLDGLSVTYDLCHEILYDPSYNVRILSLRDVKNLHWAKFRDALQHACRPDRPEGSPRLKALYVFGPKEAGSEKTRASTNTGYRRSEQALLPASSEQAGDEWWCKRGRLGTRPISKDWINCMSKCQGIIAFDAIICQGPRHANSPVFEHPPVPMMADTAPAAATHAVGGCDSCGKAPEGLITQESCSPLDLPLLSPVPIMASSVRAATCPSQPGQSFVPRCGDCLIERYCACCHKWWCETCHPLPGQEQGSAFNNFIVVDEEDGVANFAQMLHLQDGAPKIKSRVSKSCWECGKNCETCIKKTQRVCKKCCAGYCIVHNEGSSPDFCDWCISRGRGLGRQDPKPARMKLVPSSIPADLIRRRMRDAVTRPLI